MINNAVEIADGCLFCPQCGNDYLHHGVVTVFDRGEDDNVTRVTTVRHTEPDDEAAQEPAPASELVPSCRSPTRRAGATGSRSPSGAKTATASAS